MSSTEKLFTKQKSNYESVEKFLIALICHFMLSHTKRSRKGGRELNASEQKRENQKLIIQFLNSLGLKFHYSNEIS